MRRLLYSKTYPREHRIWKAMKARCYAKSNANTGNYQKLHIEVCERWKSFKNFIDDMGPCPDNYTLDRIDTYGNYCPENCRWASWSEQAKNRGNFNKIYTYKGKTMCLKDWAREYGIKYVTLHMRTIRHPEFTIEQLLTYKNPATDKILYNGVYYTRKELCDKYNISLKLFYDRWHKGWPLERILNTPKLTSKYDERNNITNRTEKSPEL